MRTRKDIEDCISRLKAASPAMARAAFEPLEEAVEAFFTKDAELEQAIGESLYLMAFDQEYRNTVYKNKELMPALRTDFPAGYEDVRDLFDGGGAWEEMASIQTEAFVRTFVVMGETAFNPYIQAWIERIQDARESIVPALRDIIAFCESGAANNGLAVYFEEHGGIVSAPDRKETGRRIYVAGGYQEIIAMYGLDIHVPSWLRA